MQTKPFILLIHGPSCSGKSFVTQAFLKKWPNCFRVCMDKIKWLISDYSAEKYSGTGVANRMLYKLAEAAIDEGFSLVIESNVGIMSKWRPLYVSLAEKKNIPFFEINIEAPYDVLKKRFEERLVLAEQQGTHVSVKDEAGMKHRYDGYFEFRNPALRTFDSSVHSVEEIVKEIETMLSL